MRVAFDYLQGPELGHKTRCEILQRELVARGHSIVGLAEARDWLVWDYPAPHFDMSFRYYKCLLMGQLPQAPNDYAWHPLGPQLADNTMCGAQYIIVDRPSVSWCDHLIPSVLITCGGSDPYQLTEELLSALYHYNLGVVIGPNFKREIAMPTNVIRYSAPNRDELRALMSTYRTVICAWGQTLFEALALGAPVIPITTQAEHEYEASVLGIPYITSKHDFTEETLLLRAVRGNFGIDYQGAARVVAQMEAWRG